MVDLGGGRGVLVEALKQRWGLRGAVLEREGEVKADLFSEGICPEFPTAQARSLPGHIYIYICKMSLYCTHIYV